MVVVLRSLLFVGGVLLPQLTLADGLSELSGLSGLWKVEDQAAWIELQANDGLITGTVRRNDVNPSAVGRTLLKNVVADEDASRLWHGQIYAARLGEYRDAEITLLDHSRMKIEVKVGFMSRAFVWNRVTAIP